MKVLLCHGYSKAEIVEKDRPQIGPDMALVKVCYCGVCGTDQDLFSSDCSFSREFRKASGLSPSNYRKCL